MRKESDWPNLYIIFWQSLGTSAQITACPRSDTYILVRCINRFSRPSQGTVNGGAVSK